MTIMAITHSPTSVHKLVGKAMTDELEQGDKVVLVHKGVIGIVATKDPGEVWVEDIYSIDTAGDDAGVTSTPDPHAFKLELRQDPDPTVSIFDQLPLRGYTTRTERLNRKLSPYMPVILISNLAMLLGIVSIQIINLLT